MNTSPRDPFAALRVAGFRNFQLSRFLLTFAVQMAETIVAWKVYEITRDKLSLGLIGLSEALPFIVTTLYGGLAADTFNRYKIGRATILAITLCFVAIGFFMSGTAPMIGTYGVWPVYVAIGFSGVARGFMGPAYQSILPQLLPRPLYANGATWGSNTWQTAAVVGPAFGGFVYGYTNVEISFAVAIALMLASFVVFLSVPVQETPPRSRSESLYESLTAGLRFVFNKKEMLGAISLDLFAVLFGGAVALLPVFASDILHSDARGLGLLRGAPFFGSLVMGLFLAFRPPVKRAGRNLFVAVTGFGLATIGFALSTNFALSFFMLFLTGAFDSISVVIRGTIMQLMTPDDMRGRVSSVNQIFISSSNEIGAFESGLAAKLMGTVPSVIFGGCMTLIVVATVYLMVPVMRHLQLEE
ncbi:MAG: MFS transporter [Chitinophagales bacterium]